MNGFFMVILSSRSSVLRSVLMKSCANVSDFVQFFCFLEIINLIKSPDFLRLVLMIFVDFLRSGKIF